MMSILKIISGIGDFMKGHIALELVDRNSSFKPISNRKIRIEYLVDREWAMKN
jgi:hypothetical protein